MAFCCATVNCLASSAALPVFETGIAESANAYREAAIFSLREASSARCVSFAEGCFTRLDFNVSKLLLEELLLEELDELELVGCSFWDVLGMPQELPGMVSNSCFSKATELGRGVLERGGVGFCG